MRDEVARTAWLFARGIHVPRILCMEEQADRLAVLMEAVPGVPADVSPLPVLDALAKGLAALHTLSAAECPFDESLATRLPRAAAAIAAGKVDPGTFEPRHRGIAPEALLARLIAEQPDEDIVVVHGDAMLNNIMITAQGELGFIDCGNAGRGDRYLDLALLATDIEAHHGAQAAARFVACYSEASWDRAKAGFYLDLYELF
jgi:aminoglycoside 3'-phosphotransferase II